MQIIEVIQKTPGVCGGYACVRQTRIPVWTRLAMPIRQREALANQQS